MFIGLSSCRHHDAGETLGRKRIVYLHTIVFVARVRLDSCEPEPDTRVRETTVKCKSKIGEETQEDSWPESVRHVQLASKQGQDPIWLWVPAPDRGARGGKMHELGELDKLSITKG